ncbi:MAG: hypothetical protein ACNA8P_08925 [Phycisphaerales bacterium]
MNRTPRVARYGLLMLGALLIPLGLTGCGERSDEMDEAQIRGEFEREVWEVAEYTVRARVTALPTDETHMMAYHEAIPEFRGPRGMGMDVMDMEFPLGEGVSMEGIEVGSIVSITFSVDYEEGWSPIKYRVIRMELLPEDTRLDFTPLRGDGEVVE